MPSENFVIQIQKPYKRDVYLSCSWRPDAAQDASWHVVRDLDQQGVRVVGDVRDLPTQDDDRIARIMSGVSGCVVVLPFRAEEPTQTSIFILREIRVAVDLALPIALFVDSRIELTKHIDGHQVKLEFAQASGETPITIPDKDFYGPFPYTPSELKLGDQTEGKLQAFLEDLQIRSAPREPFDFFITRLQPDFEQARNAVRHAVEREAGIPCLWSDDNRHSTNVDGIRERTRELIKHAAFVVVDISLYPENSLCESPNRAHELGIAVAYEKEVFVAAQGPRREPFFSTGDIQVHFWGDEIELKSTLQAWIANRKAEFSRFVYSRGLPARQPSYQSQVLDVPDFDFDPGKSYKAPNAVRLHPVESVIIALSLGGITLYGSLLLEDLTGFRDSFDYFLILLGIFTAILTSDLNQWFRKVLVEVRMLRWVIVLLAFSLFVFWAFTRSDTTTPTAIPIYPKLDMFVLDA